ncbi:hypothetical protein ABE099_10950 [Paenibacillus turicensis]|uniref:hypothetical protein n=1 Tax=Paenibacillus turicensis TaxID=160487 RepID=UPI003D2D0B41
MRRFMMIFLICSISILSGCNSKENDNGVVTDTFTTTIVTSEEDQQYVAKISYSAVLINKREEAIRIIEVEPVLNELMASKIDVLTSKIVNLNVPNQAKVKIVDDFVLQPKSTTPKEASKEEIFSGLNLKLDNGKIVYIDL